jgi:exo-beta-1,3-glucanase (GH17 family)
VLSAILVWLATMQKIDSFTSNAPNASAGGESSSSSASSQSIQWSVKNRVGAYLLRSGAIDGAMRLLMKHAGDISKHKMLDNTLQKLTPAKISSGMCAMRLCTYVDIGVNVSISP